MGKEIRLKFFVEGNEAEELSSEIKLKLTDKISEAVSEYLVTEQEKFAPSDLEKENTDV